MFKTVFVFRSQIEDEDAFSLSIVTYVLHLSDHPQKDAAFRRLDALAVIDVDNLGEQTKHWEIELEGSNNPWTAIPNAAFVEMTSYALLSMLERNDFDASLPVARWILSQQNERGGFASTADTFVAVLALKEFSSKAKIVNRDAEISLQYSYLKTVRRMQVSSDSPTIMQRRSLPKETRHLRLRATSAAGSGSFAVAQVGFEYNLNVTAAWPSFVLNPQVFKPSTANHVQVSICVNYIEGGSARASNLAVMEVELPSGFTADTDALPALRRYKGVERVMTTESDTKIVLYFEKITRSETCPTISAFRTHRVANQKPAAVLVYDYYDQSRRARSFYDVVPATLCDICSGDDCPDDGCPDRPKFSTFGSYAFGENVDTPSDAAPKTLSAFFAVVSVALSVILS